MTVGTDYSPDTILLEAADAAGLRLGMSALPWKTMMWVYSNLVEVSLGYGGALLEVPLLEEKPEGAPE